MRDYLKVVVGPAPYIRKRRSTQVIMAEVFWALLPIWGLSIFKYGLVSLLMGLLCLIVSVGFEHWILVLKKQKPLGVLHDYSAAITGLLLALTLPPSLPFWIAGLGALISMSLGKHIFGGLGHNPFNPAIVGRVFLQVSFTVPMTHWSPPWLANRFFSIFESNLAWPFMRPVLDGVSGATPLGLFKFEDTPTPWVHFILDQTSGCLGEVSPLLILLLGLVLAFKRALDYRIPASVISITLILSSLFYLVGKGPDPLFVLASGGFMLGAWFMATDMVSSPVTPLGVWLYGGLIALLIVSIRLWGGMPDGVAFAILLGNAVVPLIHLGTQPRVFGTQKRGSLP